MPSIGTIKISTLFMKTTEEKIKVMQAFKNGTNIECLIREEGEQWHLWRIREEPVWNWEKNDYRIAPQPELRPWKPEEVPVGALIRRKHKPENIAVILGATNVGFAPRAILSCAIQSGDAFLNDLFTYHGGHNGDRVEHSTDHGKTWLPCGIME